MIRFSLTYTRSTIFISACLTQVPMLSVADAKFRVLPYGYGFPLKYNEVVGVFIISLFISPIEHFMLSVTRHYALGCRALPWIDVHKYMYILYM